MIDLLESWVMRDPGRVWELVGLATPRLLKLYLCDGREWQSFDLNKDEPYEPQVHRTLAAFTPEEPRT